MSGVNYSLGAGKPLINREQSYVLDRKLLTVHSEDRDVSKWPNANEFEIVLPQQLLNVQSLRLVEIEVPTKINNISNLNQNNQFFFRYNGGNSLLITVPDGLYTETGLASEIQRLMRIAGGNTDIVVTFTPLSVTSSKSFFNFTTDVINTCILEFSKCPPYSCTSSVPPFSVSTENKIFANTFNWGLAYNLGFNKKTYTVNAVNRNISSDFTPNLTPDQCMYMEIEKYNSYDELYSNNQSDFDHNSNSNIKLVNGNNSYTGKVNSAFAKIPLITIAADGHVFESRNIGLQNITHYDPPNERIARLKFKFRFHDGRLLDFASNQFNFTLEFNMLRNEMGKQYNVRIPSTYAL